MQIVTDTGADMTPAMRRTLENVHVVPHSFTLDGKNYRSGIDVDEDGFYQLLQKSSGFPTTAQPAPGEFATKYRELAASDPDILSIHISSGLSGTINSAIEGAKLVPEARVTIIDTRTLSVPQAWQVIAAAKAAKIGWSKAQIVAMLDKIRAASDAMYTLETLKYLVHGGRVSHLRGLLASMLDIKPIIGVEVHKGVYEQRGRARSFKKALESLVDVARRKHPAGTKLRVQILHGDAPQAVEQIEGALKRTFDCRFLPTTRIAPVLGAHTGHLIAGFCYGLESAFAEFPPEVDFAP
jgi:DegV family protein with EDD domain